MKILKASKERTKEDRSALRKTVGDITKMSSRTEMQHCWNTTIDLTDATEHL